MSNPSNLAASDEALLDAFMHETRELELSGDSPTEVRQQLLGSLKRALDLIEEIDA
ncbi:MAG: hypothetical protein AB8G16_07640 [Gammaproteobacteria bacterium]